VRLIGHRSNLRLPISQWIFNLSHGGIDFSHDDTSRVRLLLRRISHSRCQKAIPRDGHHKRRSAEHGLAAGVHRREGEYPLLRGESCVRRIGPIGDETLIARPLGQLRMVNAASPAYLSIVWENDSKCAGALPAHTICCRFAWTF
jgi:hypothetical protein